MQRSAHFLIKTLPLVRIQWHNPQPNWISDDYVGVNLHIYSVDLSNSEILMNQLNSTLKRTGTLFVLYCITASVVYLAFTTNYIAYDSLTGLRVGIFIILLPIIIKYVIQLVTLPFYSFVERRRSINTTDLKVSSTPTVSVLVPAWNEEVGIIKTLESVIASDYPNFEVIVINDGSTDNTHQLVNRFIKQFVKSSNSKTTIRYLQLPNGGKAKALNQGLKLSKSDFIMTLDADSLMDKDTLSKMVQRFTDEKVAAVAGNVIIGNRNKPIELLQQLEYLYGFFFKRADSTFNSVYIVGGAAAAYRRSILNEVGGFDEALITEDIEMSTRLLNLGYKTRYAADAIVYTEGPSDWKSLFNQRLRWKYGRLLTFIKHRKLFFSLRKHHSPYLSMLLLPVAMYAELTLLLEGFLLTIFYGYTIIANDYMPLLFVILFINTIITIQVIFDARSQFHSNLILIAPVAWLLFYVIDVVEFQALYRSIKRLWNKQDLQWQKWQRVGLIQSASTSEPLCVEELTNPDVLIPR